MAIHRCCIFDVTCCLFYVMYFVHEACVLRLLDVEASSVTTQPRVGPVFDADVYKRCVYSTFRLCYIYTSVSVAGIGRQKQDHACWHVPLQMGVCLIMICVYVCISHHIHVHVHRIFFLPSLGSHWHRSMAKDSDIR